MKNNDNQGSFCDQASYRLAEVRCVTVRESTGTQEWGPVLNRPELLAGFWRETVVRAEWYDPEKECCVVVLFDVKNRVKGWNLISLGTQTASLMGPREVFRMAIVGNACAIAVLHGHPSGDPSPSPGDITVTRQLREAARVVDVQLLDHVIVGDCARDPGGRGYFSFREAGML